MQNKPTMLTSETDNIKVTVHIPDPDKIPEHIKQAKINVLYEILKPKNIKNISEKA